MPDYYNLWRGFAVEPRKGDCSKFLAHLHDNICQGDDALYAWVMAWFADIFQHPATRCGTSLALRGKQGVGKTKVGEVLRRCSACITSWWRTRATSPAGSTAT